MPLLHRIVRTYYSLLYLPAVSDSTSDDLGDNPDQFSASLVDVMCCSLSLGIGIFLGLEVFSFPKLPVLVWWPWSMPTSLRNVCTRTKRTCILVHHDRAAMNRTQK